MQAYKKVIKPMVNQHSIRKRLEGFVKFLKFLISDIKKIVSKCIKK